MGDDPVGATSARLLALGVARGARLDALRLLGLLMDHADRHGRARVPLESLAGEFDLDLADVNRSLAALLAVEAVTEVGGGLALAGRERPARGLRLAGFVDNLAAVLATDPGSETPVLAPADPEPPEPAPAGGAPVRRRPSVLMPVLAAAALVVAVALSAALQRDGVSPPTTFRSSAPVPARANGPETTLGPEAPTPTTAPEGSAVGPPTAGPPPPAAPESAPEDVACPGVIGPRLAVASVDLKPEDGDAGLLAPVASPMALSVSGQLVNAATAPVEVAGLDVSVPIGERRLDGSVPGPVRIPARAAVSWEVRLPLTESGVLSSVLDPEAGLSSTLATLLPPGADDVSVKAGAWRWADPGLAGSCPTTATDGSAQPGRAGPEAGS